MNEVKITLSYEQAKELGTTIYSIFSKQIEQVRKNTALNKRYLTKKETCSIFILLITLLINGLIRDYQKSRLMVSFALIEKLLIIGYIVLFNKSGL
ncbi:hypothetical protein [Enterococcus mundtii]|uniref:hypothetical protein n=1 Tax=Enterococcus mundtii TaxID=53346 RepID=UPI001F3BD5C4|nr:hypothetical protein [Enterococcus mundtii]